MDDEVRTAIIRLATEAGMRMEDASLAAITLQSRSDSELAAILDRLVKASDNAATLLRSARILAGLAG